ncbi:MAG: VOC family protein [Balneolales bacterium]
MARATIRYIADDVEAAIEFYVNYLDFRVHLHPAPGFAALDNGPVRLLLNQPGAGGAGQQMAEGQVPEPGGWNRLQLTVSDLASTYNDLTDKGATFRNNIIEGKGGKQALLQDPSGNLIELFEPAETENGTRPFGSGELLSLEEQFWTGDASFYHQHLSDDFQMVFPGVGRLSRGPAIEGIAGGPRWTDVDITNMEAIEPEEGVAIISYEASAQREGEPTRYSALVSSTYIHQNGWKLAFHHQTPL